MSERSPNGLNELSINSPNEPPINVCSCHVHVLNELSVNGLNELSVNGLNELFFKFLPHNVYGLNKIYINLLPLNERDSRRVTSESGIHGMNGLGPESALNVLNWMHLFLVYFGPKSIYVIQNIQCRFRTKAIRPCIPLSDVTRLESLSLRGRRLI